MKTNKFLLAALLAAIPFFGFAQEWDDIYADPLEKETVRVQAKEREPQKKKVVIVHGDASHMKVQANGRDVDEYNRRDRNESPAREQAYTGDTLDTDYEEYQYTDRIVRFHDPESSIKITGADEVVVYVGDDLYENYNNRGWNTNLYFGMGWGMGYYPWYDPWYVGGWYSPWYYSSWYDPWYGFGPYYGWSRWYSPWYYGGWYDPWYYGYGGFYGGGYSHGFYDGYYSSLTHNRSGRSTGVYRSSSANRSSSATARLSGRSSAGSRGTFSGRSATTNTRSAVSGRNATVNSRTGANAPRTRIIDNSGRVRDSRTGRVIDRIGTTSSRSGSVYGTSPVDRTGSYSTGRSSSAERTYQRSRSTYQRSSTTNRNESYSTPSRSTQSSRSSTYSTPSQSSTSTRSSTYSAPSRSSSSSSGSSGRSSGSSGRSSGGGRR